MAIIRQYKIKIILGLMLCMMSITICAKDEFRIIDYRLGLNSGTITILSLTSRALHGSALLTGLSDTMVYCFILIPISQAMIIHSIIIML